jgi:nucleoside-diphosphate-sugar epimerase
LPLPIGSIRNRRDLLAVSNFADLIARAVSSPRAAGHTLLARDGHPVSTPALYAAIARSLGRNARILPCPAWALHVAGSVARRKDEVMRMTGDLEIDDGDTRRLLDWSPPVDMESELAATARWFRGT